MHMPNECGAISCARRLIEDEIVLDFIVRYEEHDQETGKVTLHRWHLADSRDDTAPDICGIALSWIIDPVINTLGMKSDRSFATIFCESRGEPSLIQFNEIYGHYRAREVIIVWANIFSTRNQASVVT